MGVQSAHGRLCNTHTALCDLAQAAGSASYGLAASCWDKKICLWPAGPSCQSGPAGTHTGQDEVQVMELSAHKSDVLSIATWNQCARPPACLKNKKTPCQRAAT